MRKDCRLRHELPLKRAIGSTSRSCIPALFALLLTMMAGGCASTATKLQALKTVGIVSAIGDDFTVTQAGLTGPSDGEQRHSIEPWGLDDLVVARVSARLGPRFQVTPVTYPRASFAAREEISPFTPLNLKLKPDAALGELVHNQVMPQGLDAYVIVTKATTAYGSRGRTTDGVGVINHVAVFGASAQLHLLYKITVIDGHTFKVIDKRTAAPNQNSELARLSGPSREIGADLLSAAQNPAGSDQLKAAVIDLLDRSLDETLRDLQLIDRSAS